MGITLHGLGFRYGNHNYVFDSLDFAAPTGSRIAIVGANASGKTTLLRLMAGLLQPTSGEIVRDSQPYYVPQHVTHAGPTVADALGAGEKLRALEAITAGSTSQDDYDALGEDWDIAARCLAALSRWLPPGIGLQTPMEKLSGGEKTRVLLAGIEVSQPSIVLLDEPTNHLDSHGREMLCEYIASTRATVVVVSHDISLLETFDTTCELVGGRMRVYGGNYTFWRECRAIEAAALEGSICEQEKSLRLARARERQALQRQQKRESRGERHKGELVRAMRKVVADNAQAASDRLSGDHGRKIEGAAQRLGELRAQRDRAAALRIDFGDAPLHEGKLLCSLRGANHSWDRGKLWPVGLDLDIYSGERIHLRGGNGSGKTTLLRIITGQLRPSDGEATLGGFSHIFMDQHYAQADTSETVLDLAMRHNTSPLAGHEVKTRLHRAMFPHALWDKPCCTLSGGERMRLWLCCMMLSNSTPDVMVLDEPTNNLDIASLGILLDVLKGYRGTLVVVTHDEGFAREVGLERVIDLK